MADCRAKTALKGWTFAGRLAAALAAFVLSTAPGSAVGQDASGPDGSEAVRDRVHLGYGALGLRHGAIVHYPQLSVKIEARDDRLADHGGPQRSGDLSTFVHIEPQWTVRLEGARHQASLELAADLVVEPTDQPRHSERRDRHGWRAQADWRGDLGRSGRAAAMLQQSRQIERPSGFEASSDLEAEAVVEITDAAAEWSGLAGPVRLSLSMDWRDAAYRALDDDGTSVDPAWRDYEQTGLGLRVSRAITSDTAVFLGGAYERRDRAMDEFGISTALEWRVGVAFGGVGVWRGEVSAGGASRRVAQGRPASVDVASSDKRAGLALDARLTWLPTALTTVQLEARRRMEDRIVWRGDDSTARAGHIETEQALSGGLRIDHELRRNLVLSARARWREQGGDGAEGHDRRRSIGVGAQWRLNRRLALEGAFERSERWRGASHDRPSLAVNDFVITMIARL